MELSRGYNYIYIFQKKIQIDDLAHFISLQDSTEGLPRILNYYLTRQWRLLKMNMS